MSSTIHPLRTIAILCSVLCLSTTLVTTVRAQTTPNIIFIMADDMGYGDIGAYNGESQIETPNLNQLAKQGTGC